MGKSVKYSRNLEASGGRRDRAEGGWLPGKRPLMPVKDQDLILSCGKWRKSRLKQVFILKALLRRRWREYTGG